MAYDGLRHAFDVDRTVTCKRCGHSGLAWYKANSGRVMLVQTYALKGRIVGSPFSLHRCDFYNVAAAETLVDTLRGYVEQVEAAGVERIPEPWRDSIIAEVEKSRRAIERVEAEIAHALATQSPLGAR